MKAVSSRKLKKEAVMAVLIFGCTVYWALNGSKRQTRSVLLPVAQLFHVVQSDLTPDRPGLMCNRTTCSPRLFVGFLHSFCI
jgi:hypothetical protein